MDPVFTERSLTLGPVQAESIAQEYFGVRATARPLGSERDQNFHLCAENGIEYLLKISHPAEDRLVTNFQTSALRHIAARSPDLPVSRVLLALSGDAEPLVALPKQSLSTVRLLSFLQGEPLHRATHSPRQRGNLGRCLARLGMALDGFSHPASEHKLLWDLKHASRIRALLGHIPDGSRRTLATRFLDAYESHVLPVQSRLRTQVIHNDLNPHNVLVDPDDHDRIAGILDFGDMVKAPLVNDVAVAAAYQLAGGTYPLETASQIVAGYHAIRALQPAEIDLLFDLIGARLAMTVAITGWRAARYPENSAYILRNNPTAWAALERIAPLSRNQAQAYLRHACAME